jgi:hypothetical protein
MDVGVTSDGTSAAGIQMMACLPMHRREGTLHGVPSRANGDIRAVGLGLRPLAGEHRGPSARQRSIYMLIKRRRV